MPSNTMSLIAEASQLLGKNNRQMAELMGISRRSIQRWYNGHGFPIGFHYERIARALHPTHPEAAARTAAAANTTLEALGLVKRPVELPAPVPPPAKPIEPRLGPEHLDSVLSAAADVLNLAPKAVRPAFAAAFARARALGLAAEPLIAALSGNAVSKK